jgi:nucleoid-associated protein YgaU
MPDNKKPDFSNVVSGGSSTAASPAKPAASPGAKPDFSNVVSGSSSTAATPAGKQEPTVRTYIVQKGDSLSKIAKKFYGSANDWKRIHEANKALIKNPDLIQPGWTLTIPD